MSAQITSEPIDPVAFHPTYGFDRWVQVPKEACLEFLAETGTPSDRLVDLAEIAKLRPTILNVSGYWIEDVELYDLSTVQYVLSDTLYNSGSAPGEGVFHYCPEWKSVPESFGFVLSASLPALDIYRRTDAAAGAFDRLNATSTNEIRIRVI